MYLLVICILQFVAGWPLTWESWGIPKWSGKSPGKWKVRGKL